MISTSFGNSSKYPPRYGKFSAHDLGEKVPKITSVSVPLIPYTSGFFNQPKPIFETNHSIAAKRPLA